MREKGGPLGLAGELVKPRTIECETFEDAAALFRSYVGTDLICSGVSELHVELEDPVVWRLLS